MRICHITGKTAQTGHNVSHSNKKSKRTFDVNLQTKNFFDAEADEWITLPVSAAGIRHINKRGLAACLKDAREKGYVK